MSKAAVLAERAAGLRFEDLPEDVVFKAKSLLLDQLGCQLAFADLPWSQAVVRYAQLKQARGASTVVRHGLKLDAEDAAMCNAVFGHGFEMDDTDMSTTSHPAVCVVPPVLALAEQEGSTGAEALTAMVAGYEVMLRVARAADAMRYNFFHASSVPGAFGAAAATAKLRGMDAALMAEALGIATTTAAGNTEYTQSGGTVKRTLGSTGVLAGMRAALLAEAGITGPGQAFEGRKSFLRGICPEEPVWDELDKGFDDEWMIRGVGTKPYCCCAGQHAVIDAAEALRAQGVRHEDIASALITQPPREFGDVGAITMPDDVVSSQFCGRFAFALRMVRGSNGYFDYTQANVDDPVIRDLVARTDYARDDGERLTTTQGPAIVSVTLKDGRVLEEQVDFALGRKENPMSHEDVVAKFRGLVSQTVSPERAQAIIDAVMTIDAADSVSRLTELLVVERG